MNTNDENLRSTVLQIFEGLQLEKQLSEAKLKEKMFTLRYAQEASRLALENLNQAEGRVLFKKEVKQQAVISANTAKVQLSFAQEANLDVENAVTNVAVCAANMQIACNAIMRLEGTLGSVYSIISAADFGSDIFVLAEEARNSIDSTAYDAELASMQAMTSSMSISEVSASAVYDLSVGVNGSIDSLLANISSELESASVEVAAADLRYKLAISGENVAGGEYETAKINHSSSAEAYEVSNAQLNLNLKAFPKKGEEHSTVSVEFNFIKNPLYKGTKQVLRKTDKGTPLNLEPIDSYQLFFVKYSKRSTFTIAKAESIIESAPDQVVQLDFSEPSRSSLSNPAISYQFIASETGSEVLGVSVDIPYNAVDAGAYTLKDADGDEIKSDNQYVVFVRASYTEKYKRTINNFNDYLSAPCIYNSAKTTWHD